MSEVNSFHNSFTNKESTPEINNYISDICKLFDRDSDGNIYMEDIDDLIKALGIMVTENNDKDIEEFKRKFKKNEKVSIEMFYELYKVLQSKAKSKEDEEKELTEAFEFFDGENSGYIDIDYFKKALMSFGNKLTENEVDKLLEHVSFDKTNKQFKYKELIQTILKK